MPLIQVRVIKGVFRNEQKRQIISKLIDAIVSIKGENMRQVTLWRGRGGRKRRTGDRRQGDDHRRRPRSGTRQSCPRGPMCRRSQSPINSGVRLKLFDDFVGFRHEHRRHAEVERLDGLQIDDQLELGRLLDR